MLDDRKQLNEEQHRHWVIASLHMITDPKFNPDPIEYLETLPEPYRTQALQNLKQRIKNAKKSFKQSKLNK